jgi:ubiquinone/menaquinone biosynthesis C-methylase UbiE
MRCLEIGPGNKPIKGFETFNLGKTLQTDGGTSTYVGDARNMNMFLDHTFDIVYASHIIEHIQWYQIEDTIKEWARIIKPNGILEVWTVDSYKIAKAIVTYEEIEIWNGPDIKKEWKTQPVASYINGDPYKWASGRIMSYPRSGDYDANLHRAVLTPKYLKKCFKEAGLINVTEMSQKEVRGTNHGWINMGIKGIKP